MANDPSSSPSPNSPRDKAPVPHRQVPLVLGGPLDVLGFIAGPLAMVVWIFGVDVGLNIQAHRLAGVMLLTIIWWITEPVPIAVTGLFAVVLAVIVGAVPSGPEGKPSALENAFTPFAHPTTFFLLGGMFLGRAMSRSGLDRRLALGILTQPWAGNSPARLLTAVGLSVAVVSMWISNTAATAMVYPVALGMITVLSTGSGQRGLAFARSPYATALLLMTAYASTIGGLSTPIGTTTNVVAMGYFKQPDFFGRSIDFFRWSVVGLPMTVALLAALVLWLRWLGPPRGLDMPALRHYLRDERAKLGPWNRGEWNTLAVFLIVVAMWLAPGVIAIFSVSAREWYVRHFPEEVVAMLAPVMLYLLPVDWRRREFSLDGGDLLKVDWGTLLLFGAGISLGTMMKLTGLANVIGAAVLETLGTDDPWVIMAVAIAGGVLLSEITSNAATAAALIPVVFELCQDAQIDPLPSLMGVTFGASFGNALPVSTPPNAMVYGSGLIPVRRMVVAGLGLDILGGVVIWVVLRVAFAWGWTPLG